MFGEGWLYQDYIFTPDNIWWEVIISWHYIFTPDNIWWGMIILWHYIFTPLESGTGGNYIWISSLPIFDYLKSQDIRVTKS